MSVEEIVTLAAKIVNREKVTMPALESWELGELFWWIHNLGTELA